VLCAQLWLGEKPHYGMHRILRDMVCLAAIHAMNVGWQAAWSVSDRVASPDLVANAVKRIVKAAFSGMCWQLLLCLLCCRCQLVMGCLLTNLSWLGQWWLCVAAACEKCSTRLPCSCSCVCLLCSFYRTAAPCLHVCVASVQLEVPFRSDASIAFQPALSSVSSLSRSVLD
jgi:hypothetical protein